MRTSITPVKLNKYNIVITDICGKENETSVYDDVLKHLFVMLTGSVFRKIEDTRSSACNFFFIIHLFCETGYGMSQKSNTSIM